jgi:hypothetical protein
MIEPLSATVIIVSFLIIWAIIIPIVGAIPKIGKIISYRYLLVTVFLACMIGVVINYHDLDTQIKLAVIIGSSIISGVYLLARSFEKWIANGWCITSDISAKVSKGDIKAELLVKPKDSEIDSENPSTKE